MGFLADYMLYTSGTECPRNYRIWSGLSLLSHSLGRRFWLMHGRFPIHPQFNLVLVGDAGSGKSTAKNATKAIYSGEYPAQMVSASFQSHQDIIDMMCNAPQVLWEEAKPDGFKKTHGYTPFYIICNELSSLLSTDKKGMVEFLVDIYDENEFSTGFKGQRKEQPEKKQRLDNPCISVLACAVPKWFMGNLKLDLFDGGLGRRLIIVYDTKTDIVPNPDMVPGGAEAKERLVAHLHSLDKVYGEIKRSPAAMGWWEEWYREHKRKVQVDPILGQFDQTKHVHVLKIAMALCASELPFVPLIEVDHLKMAVKLLDDLEPSIVRLTSGIGRNELAGIGSQLLDYLSRMGGASTMVQTKKIFRRYLDRPEFQDVMNSFIETDEVFMIRLPWEGVDREILMLPHFFEEYFARKQPNHPVYISYLERKGKGISATPPPQTDASP